MSSFSSKFVVICLVFLFVDNSSACAGHKVTINYIRNCGGPNQIITVAENSTLKLIKNCDVIPNVCVSTEAFTTATLEYTVTKNGMVVARDTRDVCNQMTKTNAEAKKWITLFGIPDRCPIAKAKICADESKTASFEKYKGFLSMARGGPIKIDVEMEHDTGKSCFSLELLVEKK